LIKKILCLLFFAEIHVSGAMNLDPIFKDQIKQFEGKYHVLAGECESVKRDVGFQLISVEKRSDYMKDSVAVMAWDMKGWGRSDVVVTISKSFKNRFGEDKYLKIECGFRGVEYEMNSYKRLND